MHNHSQKGISTAAALGTGAIIIIILAVIYMAVTSLPSAVPTSNTPIASTTVSTTGTTTDNTTPDNSTTRTYANPTLGFSFDYPRDLLLKTEGFSTTTGSFTADFQANRGDIIVTVTKVGTPNKDVKQQTKTVKIGSREANQYTTRRDVCDDVVNTTNLDSNYVLTIVFQSCGQSDNELYLATQEIISTLASVKFTNDNSFLYVNTKNNFAFRYPSIWNNPKTVTTSTTTQITFGQDMSITIGQHPSTDGKKNLVASEVATSAMTATSTTSQKISVDSVPSYLLTTTPTSGAAQRTVYTAASATSTNVIILKQIGIDSSGLDLVISNFGFIK